MSSGFEDEARARSWLGATAEMRRVRAAEFDMVLAAARPDWARRILDYGGGDGTLALLLAEALDYAGAVTVVDTSKVLTDFGRRRTSSSPIEVLHLAAGDLPLPSGSQDVVVCLATLHHVDHKAALLDEFNRVLLPGGRLVIADVADGTPVQRYFDGPVNAFSSTGHRHAFLTEDWARELCSVAQFTEVTWSIERTPWSFADARHAGRFLRSLHDALCSPEDCYRAADEYVGFRPSGTSIELQWELALVTASRPAHVHGEHR